MERVVSLPKHRNACALNADMIRDNMEENSLEPIDCAAAAATFAGELLCHQYVVLSPTFGVPTLYFSVHDSSALFRCRSGRPNAECDGQAVHRSL